MRMRKGFENEDLIDLAYCGDKKAQYELGSWLAFEYEFGFGLFGLRCMITSSDDKEQWLEEAAKWYQLSAEQGYVEAQHALGRMYEQGLGVVQDGEAAAEWYQKAIKQYQKLAEDGDVEAQYTLGRIYEFGSGVGRFFNEEEKWYEMAGEGGVQTHTLDIMHDCGDGVYGVCQNGAEAAKWYEMAAENEDAFAFYALGRIYEYGNGVAQSYEKAVKWYEKAVGELGAYFANQLALKLGRMYEQGLGVEKNDRKACRYYERAARCRIEKRTEVEEARDRLRQKAEQGYVYAQFSLGRIHENDKDYEEAVKWYQKAAEQGNAAARCLLSEVYAQGDGMATDDKEAARYQRGHGVHEDDGDAVKWNQKEATQGNVWAMARLGEMYEQGKGVPQNYDKAVKWYKASGICGIELGDMYEKGRGVRQDYEEAVKWYRASAERGDEDAALKLGRMYEQGLGVGKNHEESVRWYRKAACIMRKSAEDGDAEEQYRLGYMYEHGLGVKKDEDKAMDCYLAASDQKYMKARERLLEKAKEGNARAQYEVALLYSRGFSLDFFEEPVKVIKWMRKAAKQGYVLAQRDLGRWREWRGCYVAAALWYQKAAAQGSVSAQKRLDRLYEKGHLSKVSIPKMPYKR